MYHVTDIHSKVSWNLHNGSDSDHNFYKLLLHEYNLCNNAVIFNGSTRVYIFFNVFTEIFNKCNFQFHLYIHNNENYFELVLHQNILGNHSDLDCFDYSIILPNGYKQDKQNSYDQTFRLKWPNNYYDFDKYFDIDFQGSIFLNGHKLTYFRNYLSNDHNFHIPDFKGLMIFLHGHKLLYFRHYLSDDHNFLMPVYSVCNCKSTTLLV